MGIWHKQVLFTQLVGEFINECFKRGYKIAGRDWKATDGHMPGSLHYLSLAWDFVIYTDQGDYLEDTEAYIECGHIWESLHPDAYSGIRFDDGGHISLTHNGRK